MTLIFRHGQVRPAGCALPPEVAPRCVERSPGHVLRLGCLSLVCRTGTGRSTGYVQRAVDTEGGMLAITTSFASRFDCFLIRTRLSTLTSTRLTCVAATTESTTTRAMVMFDFQRHFMDGARSLMLPLTVRAAENVFYTAGLRYRRSVARLRTLTSASNPRLERKVHVLPSSSMSPMPNRCRLTEDGAETTSAIRSFYSTAYATCCKSDRATRHPKGSQRLCTVLHRCNPRPPGGPVRSQCDYPHDQLSSVLLVENAIWSCTGSPVQH